MSIAGLAGVASTVAEGAKIIKKITDTISDTKSDIAEPLKNTAGKALNTQAIDGAVVEGDVIKLLKATLVEPKILVTENAMYSEVMDNVAVTIVDNVAAYYIQVFDILTKLRGMSSVEAIDLLSSDLYQYDDVMKNATKGAIKSAGKLAQNVAGKFGLESLNLDSSLSFLSTEELKNYEIEVQELAVEADDNEDEISLIKARIDTENKSSNTRNKLTDIFFDSKDGSIFKMLTRKFEVTIGFKRAEDVVCYINIPIIIRASLKVISVNDLVPVIGNKDAKKTFLARFHEWRSGSITLLDLLFCGDLIKNYKEGNLDKNAKLLTDIEKQNTAVYLRKVLTGSKGFESMYTNLILTSDEINYLSKVATVGGGYTKVSGTGYVDLESNEGKDFLLNAVNGFMLAVIDTERVRIYIKGIKGCLDTNHRVFKRKNDNTTDALEFFRAMSSGNAIRF